MTVGSRRLAARCRERFVTDPSALTATEEPDLPEPRTTVDTAEVETAIPQQNVEAAAT
jgi:hypothetical protein